MTTSQLSGRVVPTDSLESQTPVHLIEDQCSFGSSQNYWAAGLTICLKAIPASDSAFICVSVPANPTGDIAPENKNGEIIVLGSPWHTP